MTKLNRRHTLGLIGAAAATSVVGLPVRAANTKINVGALRFTSHAASFVAFERGYFSDEGLDVEFKFFQAAQPMAVAIASGDADYAVTAISGGLISLAEKGAAKVIGGALSEEAGIDGQKILASDAAFKAGVDAPRNSTARAGPSRRPDRPSTIWARKSPPRKGGFAEVQTAAEGRRDHRRYEIRAGRCVVDRSAYRQAARQRRCGTHHRQCR